MIVGVPRETFPGERRVALVPAVIPSLVKAGLEIVVEAGAGVEAGYPDADYVAKGAKILAQRAEVFLAAIKCSSDFFARSVRSKPSAKSPARASPRFPWN